MTYFRIKIHTLTFIISLFSFQLLAQTQQLTNTDEEIRDAVEQKIFDNQKNKILNNVMVFYLEKAHFAPKELDDSLSLEFYNEYIKNVDRAKNFLLQMDIYELSDFKYDLDDQLMTDRLDFFNLTQNILKKRTKEVQEIYREILAQPFDYTIDETIEMDPDNVDYAKNLEELKERWRKALKFQTISHISTAMDNQTKAAEKSDTVTIKTFEELEVTAREKILKRQDDWFHRMIDQVNNTDRISQYENALCAVFDPHTNYFPPKLKEDFDIRFSGQLEGIGATLSPKDGYIRIVDIVPGSPAWKTGELKKEDLIMKVGQNDEDPVDVYDMRLDDAVKMIRGPKGTEVRLTIKKPDGTIKVLPIIRDVVIREETYAKSAVIEAGNKEDFKIGYIFLPSFYTNFNDPKGRSCGEDMRKELEKITSEGINDIIIDLRGNGGGSLGDAVQIAGLFIDEGPVVQRENSMGQARVLEDRDPKTQFDGNIVVLVSETSASASEILAAALQDYKRAVIVGSNSTFGKGTVQQFVDIDRLLPSKFNEFKSFGSLKITMEKFYRINGGATQLKGVTPDVILPTNYSYIDFGEKEMDFALPWDEIEPADYEEKIKYIPNYQYIAQHSQKRIENSHVFQQIDDYAKWVKEQRENTLESLNFEQFELDKKIRKDYLDQFDNIGKDTLDMVVYDLAMDTAIINNDSTKRVTTDEWHDDITKDNYILESINILEDLNAIRED